MSNIFDSKQLGLITQLKWKDIPDLRDKILREDQNGLCPLCRKEPDKPCLDHEHKKKLKGSGLIRGVVCLGCNIYLGRLENGSVRYGIKKDDIPFILRNAADYLEKEQYPFLHPSEKPKQKTLSKNCFKRLSKEYINKYPKRKPLEYPKSKHLTKKLERLFKKLNIEIQFNKN